MPLTQKRLETMLVQMEEMCDCLQDYRDEMGVLLAKTILNNSGLVRPNWLQSMKKRINQDLEPIIYSSHFEIDNELMMPNMQAKLLAAFTYIGSLVAHWEIFHERDERDEKWHRIYTQYNQLARRDVPLAAMFFAIYFTQSENEHLTKEQRFILREASGQLKDAMEKFTDGKPPGV